MSRAWGSEPGDMLKMPTKKRLELAKRLSTPKFEEMANLIGPYQREADAQQARKVIYTPEEIVDLTLGNDIPRLIPSELARLQMGDDDLADLIELLFYKDFVAHNLVQYEMQGYEKLAKGGIIYCHDGSSSMEGPQEIRAKAVGLALLHIARKQKRSFYGIQFGNANEIRIDDFRDTSKLTPEKVLAFAEFFFHGGTNFQRPLEEALAILKKEHDEFGAVRADIVFATDGQAGVTRAFMEEFKTEQKRLDFKVYGIAIGADVGSEPLREICDGNVTTIKKLLNSKDIGSIFKAV